MISIFNKGEIKQLSDLMIISKYGTTSEDCKFCQKLIKNLVKRLKKLQLLNEYLNAVTTQDANSNCIIFKRTLDNRIQIGKTKITPHLAYCRLWRFPEVLTVHQLRAVSHCKFPYPANKSSVVCVNPYHYELCQSSELPVYVSNECDVDKPSTPLVDNEINNLILEGINFDWFGDNFDIADLCTSELGSTVDACNVDSVRPEVWCSIRYHEFNEAVGETFQAKNPTVIVDGYTDTSGNNFSLGLLANVNRNECAKNCRRHICHGIKLTTTNDGMVFLECLCEYPVFIQSPNVNEENGWPLATVCRLSSQNCRFKIFDTGRFARTLSQCMNDSYESVYSLTKLSTIRLSFVKGWGLNYRRQTISATPCWLEIRINGACQMLDRVLRKMSPTGCIDSKT